MSLQAPGFFGGFSHTNRLWSFKMFSGDTVSREHLEGRCQGEGPNRLLYSVEWYWHCPECRVDHYPEYYLRERDERAKTHRNMHAAYDFGQSEVLRAHGLPDSWRSELPDMVWDYCFHHVRPVDAFEEAEIIRLAPGEYTRVMAASVGGIERGDVGVVVSASLLVWTSTGSNDEGRFVVPSMPPASVLPSVSAEGDPGSDDEEVPGSARNSEVPGSARNLAENLEEIL